jgi:hypothetical protein
VLPNLIALAYLSFHYIDSATTGWEETQKGQESQILSLIIPTFVLERWVYVLHPYFFLKE